MLFQWTHLRTTFGIDPVARPKRTCAPEVSPLEGRSLMAVVGLDVSATPATLRPAGGRMVEVTVQASFTDTTPETLPSLTNQVSDEYGQVQPVSIVTLVPQANGRYSVSLPVELRASRRGNDRDGRQYTISLTVVDDGSSQTDSAVVTVLHDRGRRERPTPGTGRPGGPRGRAGR